jgi:hypothetical protein
MRHGESHRTHRRRMIRAFYEKWFRDLAGSGQMGSPEKGTIGSSSGPAEIKEDK